MKYPKLKQALLSRIMTYVTVLGIPTLLIVIFSLIPYVHIAIKVIFGIAMLLLMIIYILKNIITLMTMDITLALLHCRNTAGKQFDLPEGRSLEEIERCISRFGKEYSPLPLEPHPDVLRYKVNTSLTIYSKAKERILMIYRTECLTDEGYRAIYNSARANSRNLIGKKRPLFVDRYQKTSPLKRATVAVIFAASIEENLRRRLFDTLCKQNGDGNDVAIIPCVVDIGNRVAIFNSLRDPYVGFGYPAQNSAINLIKKQVFGGKLPPVTEEYKLDPPEGIDPEMSLWQFWRGKVREHREDDGEKKRFEEMSHGDVIFDDGFIYVKWQTRGVWLAAELDEDKKRAKIDPIISWYYPKSNSISRNDAFEIKKTIAGYFYHRGYNCEFQDV